LGFLSGEVRMALQERKLARHRSIFHDLHHRRVQLGETGERPFVPGLLGDPWRFLEDAAELLNESCAIHVVAHAHIRLARACIRDEPSAENPCGGQSQSPAPKARKHLYSSVPKMWFS